MHVGATWPTCTTTASPEATLANVYITLHVGTSATEVASRLLQQSNDKAHMEEETRTIALAKKDVVCV